jgi:SAM-dependent methyltransferase
MEQKLQYPKADKYPDLYMVYKDCCGPGGLKAAEFLCDKIQLAPGTRMMDIGMNRGLQTCFMAREYDVNIVSIDPGRKSVAALCENAKKWNVEDKILAIELGMPGTKFADESFPVVYSATTFEMFRCDHFSPEMYCDSLREVLRILKPGGYFLCGEPMHRDVPIPEDLAPTYTQGIGAGPEGWEKCFATAQETADAVTSVGFEVLEYGEAPDGYLWWWEFAEYDNYFVDDPENAEANIIRQDRGRWLTYGYVIARKPKMISQESEERNIS